MKKSAALKNPAAQYPVLLKLVVRALDDKKAEDLRVLEVKAQSSITDYLVLATGTSEPHLRALRLELEKSLEQVCTPIVGIENHQGSGWTVFDAFEVMVHIFTAENRAKYRLELLWKDARNIVIADLLATRVEPKRRRSATAPRRRLLQK